MVMANRVLNMPAPTKVRFTGGHVPVQEGRPSVAPHQGAVQAKIHAQRAHSRQLIVRHRCVVQHANDYAVRAAAQHAPAVVQRGQCCGTGKSSALFVRVRCAASLSPSASIRVDVAGLQGDFG